MRLTMQLATASLMCLAIGGSLFPPAAAQPSSPTLQHTRIELWHSQKQIQQSASPLPPSLIAAMKQDLDQYVSEFSPGNYSSFSGYIFFVDLNDDQVEEAIVYPKIGIPCSNRSCSIFIYTKIGETYRKISANETDRYSSMSGSRNSPSIGILPTSSFGWHDLATRRFDYETRTEKWIRSHYGSDGYTDSLDVIIPTPRRIVEELSALYVDFNTLFIPQKEQ